MSTGAGRRLLGDVLLAEGLVDEQRLARALREQERGGGQLGDVLLAMGALSPEALARALAVQAGLPFVDLSALDVPAAVAGRIDGSTCALYRAVPVAEDDDGTLVVALADALNTSVLQDLQFLVGGPVRAVLAAPEAIDQRLSALAGATGTPAGMKEAIAQAASAQASASGTLDLEDGAAMAAAAPVVRLLNYILLQAIRDKASDVHLEPFDDEFKVRYRVDGSLFEVEAPPRSLAAALVSRVKVMADLDIAETRLPQDGRIELSLGGRPIDLRVSTMPTVHGEGCVLRVLDRSVVQLDLGRVGLSPEGLATLEDLLQRPHGMLLVTGPTGSGKTTTLYSALNRLNDVERKIITVEDPIEYDLDGIVQVQVNEEIGVTYASVLRTILRQDPDILLVGEIRDAETAHIAVEAALTGHLVLSTLHTNDAPSTITRLLDIGIPPYLIVATLEAVVAQRLVRTICPACRVEVEPDDLLLRELGVDRAAVGGRRFALGRGCEACNWSGHRGRTALFEIMPLGERLRQLVLAGAPTQELRAAATAEGMATLREAGQRAVLAGTTTVEEVLRETLLDT